MTYTMAQSKGHYRRYRRRRHQFEPHLLQTSQLQSLLEPHYSLPPYYSLFRTSLPSLQS